VKQFQAYQGEEHRPFCWNGGAAAALLVHGFPGTPAEMRPLGQALHRAGWTAHGLLLPGFGAQIETLPEKRFGEWAAAVRDSLIELRREHSAVVLVGYSMGGALALQVAARDSRELAGVVLISPFWQLGTRGQQLLWPAIRLLLRQIRPFEKADFDDPELRRSILQFMPEADLDDEETRRFVRSISLPTRTLDELRKAGRAAFRNAPAVALPTLVVQGTRDEVVRPEHTRRLIERISGRVSYRELGAGHDLIRADHPAWPEVETCVLEFARACLPSGQ